MSSFALEDLVAIVRARAGADAEASYTKSLLDKGPARCAKKLGEEAVETVIAALGGDQKAIRAEAADLLYHLVVLLEATGTPVEEVMAELERRTARSGHEEKAART